MSYFGVDGVVGSMFLEQELLNGVVPIGPLATHLGLWYDPISQGLVESVSMLRSWCGERPAKLPPYFPTGVVGFLLIDTLPIALGLDRFQVSIVYSRIKVCKMAFVMSERVVTLR